VAGWVEEEPVTFRKNSFCSYCGTRFHTEQPWPRTCSNCQQISYLNPLPVAVTLLPVDGGLLCVRRSIEPAVGQLSLPGGFMDLGETWQEAAARELWEEAGVHIDPNELELFRVLSSRTQPFLLIFGIARPRPATSLPPFAPNDEASERVVVPGPIELAFPLHTQAMREFFAQRSGGAISHASAKRDGAIPGEGGRSRGP
jgi:ADP-ribose pyrophosphatase YjhB (NUDIX family)